ncbi:MAG: mitochondrial fission ELM1 family protein [Pontiellaceae bacterium]|nr:mitochondrial fission ELM1 family protein [Pontiellaceae bacterium]MBN2784557.1 mitochondrial fission ELM1 family protein [Pontiellaceae bacterium]
MKLALIVSDGKPGHFNQSIALCKHLGLKYEIIEVAYKSRAAKACSYLLDRLGIFTGRLLSADLKPNTEHLTLIISTGSTTYYANKLLARRMKIPNVAILYPKSYRLDFSHILCPAYDHPPKRNNITELPLNLCAAEPAFFKEKAAEFSQKHSTSKPAAGIVIGGPNAISDIDPDQIKQQLERVFALTEGMERWVTTSRRTPKEVEAIIESMPFDYTLINSRDAYNPIPAFIQLCDRLFVTSDSASMISECASFGTAKVEILMNRQLKTPNKFEELIGGLEQKNAVHIFDGTLGNAAEKIDPVPLLSAVSTLLTHSE